jgi:hypothetical protein
MIPAVLDRYKLSVVAILNYLAILKYGYIITEAAT